MRILELTHPPAEMIDRALLYAHYGNLPKDYTRPCFTRDWPPENIPHLDDFVVWLFAGGCSPNVIRTVYLPMAGVVLGLSLKPFFLLNPIDDIEAALALIKAKKQGPEYTKVCKNAILKYRQFLFQFFLVTLQKKAVFNPRHLYGQGIPVWLLDQLEKYQRVRQKNWRPARLENSIRRFWLESLKVWRFMCETYMVTEIGDIQRSFLQDYVDKRLAAGCAVTTINAELINFRVVLLFLQDQGYSVPNSILRIPTLTPPDPLPRFLTDEQVRLLRNEMENRVTNAVEAHHLRDRILDRAAFYLLWQCGLRIGEVEDLHLEDLDLKNRKIMIRESKNLKDRVVFMTDTTIHRLKAYLEIRGPGTTDHVFLYRHRQVRKDFIRERIKAVGRIVGVRVYPHRLRHTAATQLLNAGCRITSIQKFLGHKELSTTMV